jgi:hypothetical protein
MNGINELPRMSLRPQLIFAADRAECRRCRAHVRVIARNTLSAIAWCNVCCTTSIYDLEPTRTAA